MADYHLKCEHIAYTKVDYWDLQKFIAEVFGLGHFEILESDNDTTHEYTVSAADPDQREHERAVKAIQQKSVEYYGLGAVLNRLARIDAILPGKYLVRVSW